MAKGDVCVCGPYLISDTTTMDTDITAAVNAKLSAVTSFQDAGNHTVTFIVVTMEA